MCPSESSEMSSSEDEEEEADTLVFRRVDRINTSEKNDELMKQAKRRDHAVTMAMASSDLANAQGPPIVDEVDDIDGVDPVQEYHNWKLRERRRHEREIKEMEIIEEEIQAKMENRSKKKKRLNSSGL